jgi:hypothetical protein
VVAGAKAGEIIDAGLATRVTWSLTGNALRRSEVVRASREVKIRRIWMAVPTRANRLETSSANGMRTDRLISKEGVLDIRVLHSDWPIHISALATGDDPLGRGDRGAIPLHLVLKTVRGLSLAPGGSLKWEIELSSVPASDH